MATTKSDRLHLLSFATDLVGRRAAVDVEAFVGGVPAQGSVVVDLTRLQKIDALSVAALRRSAVACRARSVAVAIAVVTEQVRWDLIRGGLDQLAPLVETVEDALRSLRSPLPS